MTTIMPSASPATSAAISPAAVPSSGTTREQLSAAAKQFEAIFVRQMLSAARKSGVGDQLFSSQGTDTFRQMQDDRFAEIASSTGALGMAKMIEAHLAKMLPAEAPAGTGAEAAKNGI